MPQPLSIRFLLAAGGVLLTASAIAPAAEPPQGWSGSAELGAVYTTGNTENTSFDGKLTVNYLRAPWEHGLLLQAYTASESGQRTGERYLANYKGRRDLSERSYAFGNLRYEDDRFSGFRYQASQTLGYGRRLIDSEHHKLKGELGVGARQSETETGEQNRVAVGTLGGDYTWLISPTSSFLQTLLVVAGEDNTEVSAVSTLKVRIHQALALAVGLDVKHNTDVPAGRKNTDTKTTINLVYDF